MTGQELFEPRPDVGLQRLQLTHDPRTVEKKIGSFAVFRIFPIVNELAHRQRAEEPDES
jgi:hypothetical protein